ncbi:hypothetical protein T265_12301 [Opisthorchis viverrini]|uniref:Uncharacterized protein n=1 Tax=Opisthorchis viverrini TaxID=6198 RepID=A0A074YYR5_OPIVI|nr:hypothetical protein T265_12301 [Opisthorchis viverrini]KER18337.1 hypothetical protein T265_12301 [Opisthorchis viverrini]
MQVKSEDTDNGSKAMAAGIWGDLILGIGSNGHERMRSPNESPQVAIKHVVAGTGSECRANVLIAAEFEAQAP